MRSAQRGFTILELLLAMTLLAIVSAVAFSWLVSEERSSHAAQRELEALDTAFASIRLLNDDLIEAVPDGSGRRVTLVDADTLTLLTLDHLPGEAPGFHHVTWHIDRAGDRLMRQMTDRVAGVVPPARIISRRLPNMHFSINDSGAISIDLHLGTAEASAWSFPLWTGRS